MDNSLRGEKMKRYKAGIIGLFAYGTDDCGGGVVKTRNYEKIIKEKYGENQVITLDRANGTSSLKWLTNVYALCKKSDTVIVLFSTKKMIKILMPFLIFLKKVYKFKLLYPVLGGWLPEFVAQNKGIEMMLRHFDEVYVETISMERSLSNQLSNVIHMPNFSMRKPIDHSKIYNGETFDFCIYSRIIKEKGIGIAVDAVRKVNEKKGKNICRLTVYGKVYDSYADEFKKILNNNSEFVRYGGLLGGDAISVLSGHYMLLFPTYYQGEGFPGTLVESFMAGLPVIASDWKYNSEIVQNGETGFLFNIENTNQLVEIISQSTDTPDIIDAMRIKCLEESKKYIPENIMQPIYKWIQ